MNYDDFRREYCNMIVCNLSPDFDHDGISDRAGIIFSCSFEVRWTAFFKIAKKKTLHGFYLLFDDITEYQMSFKGSWKTSLNAGGWLECESFYQNPQYLITLHTDGKVLLFICFFSHKVYQISKKNILLAHLFLIQCKKRFR